MWNVQGSDTIMWIFSLNYANGIYLMSFVIRWTCFTGSSTQDKNNFQNRKVLISFFLLIDPFINIKINWAEREGKKMQEITNRK